MFFSKISQELCQKLCALPGVGEKSAQRICSFVLSQDNSYGLELAKLLEDMVKSHKNCQVCNILTTEEICQICQEPSRDSTKLCVVEKSEDVYLIEQTREFSGYYFVLGKLLSPIDGVGLDDIDFPKLRDLAAKREVLEIILALNPSSEGETTMNFIAQKLANYKITRLATGLPFGGDLHYTTSMTIASALRGRRSF